jgi:Secretion system C-terminal sorting domain
MKKLNIILTILFFLFSVPELIPQELVKNSVVSGTCYAGDKVNRIYIPPPDIFFRKAGMEGGASIKIYYTGFSNAAITAIEYAASVLKSMLPPDVKFTVLARWIDIPDEGVLANSSTTGFAAGWGLDALQPNALYPVALAEKIHGENLNFDLEGDIELNINSSVNWYMGINGNTPVLSYDLVTVVLHELIHGMGFFDSMSVDASTGSYGAASVPLIYDTFVENLPGKKLTDTLIFENPSTSLGTELVSGQLFFNGPLIKNYSGGNRARLYVPTSFDPGSSVAHLDENSTLEVNQLMTPFVDRGEAIHNPGKYTMSMLGDIGWINTRIVHEAPHDTEEMLSELNLSIGIVSDTAYNRNKVGLVWSTDEFTTSDTVIMTSPLNNDNFTSSVAIPSYETRVEYYFFVEDHFLRIYRSPSFIDEFKYSVYIGTDTVKPLITHVPVEFYFEVVDTIRFDVTATDNLGIDTVYIEYKVNEGPPQYLGLKPDGEDEFSNSLKIKTLSITSKDSLQYRIVAKDKAAVANQRILPSDKFFIVHFERINPVVERYSTNFSNATADFFNDGFEITKPSGFTNYGLHTKHPYESPEETGDSIGYTAMLRTPFKFDADGMIISFLEVVLVEPGEDGSVFSTPEFYDYVVVEGSANFGKSWFPLADGYDSRYLDSWVTAYNSAINGNNSIYVGTGSMLNRHSIFPKVSSGLKAGDTLMVRFRLFSDPYANGWGWGIEDLNIGPMIDNIENPVYEKMVVYPNPGSGLINIRRDEGSDLKPVKFSIYNSTGTCLQNGLTDGGEEITLDITTYPSGIYFIILYNDHGNRIARYSLIR